MHQNTNMQRWGERLTSFKQRIITSLGSPFRINKREPSFWRLESRSIKLSNKNWIRFKPARDDPGENAFGSGFMKYGSITNTGYTKSDSMAACCRAGLSCIRSPFRNHVREPDPDAIDGFEEQGRWQNWRKRLGEERQSETRIWCVSGVLRVSRAKWVEGVLSNVRGGGRGWGQWDELSDFSHGMGCYTALCACGVC